MAPVGQQEPLGILQVAEQIRVCERQRVGEAKHSARCSMLCKGTLSSRRAIRLWLDDSNLRESALEHEGVEVPATSVLLLLLGGPHNVVW